MDTAGVSTSNLESFVNDYLKEDLKHLEKLINDHDEEIMELIQLKNTIQTMQENITENRFKTQMNVGGNMFLEAEVYCNQNILVDVGKSHFVEFTLDEAIKFANFKVAVLTKQCQVIRDESVNKRSDIKLALMYMTENDTNIK